MTITPSMVITLLNIRKTQNTCPENPRNPEKTGIPWIPVWKTQETRNTSGFLGSSGFSDIPDSFSGFPGIPDSGGGDVHNSDCHQPLGTLNKCENCANRRHLYIITRCLTLFEGPVDELAKLPQGYCFSLKSGRERKKRFKFPEIKVHCVQPLTQSNFLWLSCK